MNKNNPINDTSAQTTISCKWPVIGLVLFIIIGFIFSMPCLCREGAVKGFVKSIFYALVIIRLIYGIYKKNLKRTDYFIWSGVYFTFCIAIECL
jgi:hypothetical protein